MPTYHSLTSYNVRRLFYSTVKVMMLAMITIMVPVSYSLMECIVPTQNKANSYVVCLAFREQMGVQSRHPRSGRTVAMATLRVRTFVSSDE